MNNQLILTAPAVAIPESGQKAFTLLQMLSTGQPVEKGHICSTLGEAMRSPAYFGDCDRSFRFIPIT
ncbi:hypothetical protein KW441_13535 [Vibrio fluvialis]|nr:hypothetical protein [Vibrio fluvialis]